MVKVNDYMLHDDQEHTKLGPQSLEAYVVKVRREIWDLLGKDEDCWDHFALLNIEASSIVPRGYWNEDCNVYKIDLTGLSFRLAIHSVQTYDEGSVMVPIYKAHERGDYDLWSKLCKDLVNSRPDCSYANDPYTDVLVLELNTEDVTEDRLTLVGSWIINTATGYFEYVETDNG